MALGESFRIPRVDLMDPEQFTYILNLMLMSMGMTDPIFNGKIGQAQPPSEFLYDGRLAYADGSNWDPGSGKGLYRYDGDTSSWVHIG